MINSYAVYSDYIYYDSKVETNKYLLIEDSKIIGLYDKIDENIKVYRREKSAIFPGLYNTHTHLPMVYFRGLADDLELTDWLKHHIWPAENKWLSDEFVYDASMLAICELIRSGTVAANDMYFYSNKIADAIIESGIKGVVGMGVLDFPTKFAKSTEEYLKKVEKGIEKYANILSLKISISPHAPYTVSPDNFKKCINMAQKYDTLIHTHLSESAWEIEEIEKRYGKSPVFLMDEAGLFDTKSIVAHCVHLTDNEIELLGKKKVNISHCLESNMKLASGFSPVKKLLDAGANVSIGTDGAASNNDLDILAEMSTVAKFHKAYSSDATALNVEKVIDMATADAAKSIGFNNSGILKSGFDADFMVISLDNPHSTPLYNIKSHLVYSAKSSDVTDLFIMGKPVMLNKKLTTIDEKMVLEKAKYWTNKIKRYNHFLGEVDAL